ncbi:MAG: putative virulence factor [ANME-2 cluster archaeon]|nr:putative virulence factor [ANME-2 cluster archaeon]
MNEHGNPSLLEVLSYTGYYVSAYLFYRYTNRKEMNFDGRVTQTRT